MNKYDIGIIGAGIAGTFAALRISQCNKSAKTIVLEFGRPFGKRRRQLEGALGCFPAGDGKIYPNDLDKICDVVDGRKAKPANNWVMDILSKTNPRGLLTKDTLPLVPMQKKILSSNFKINPNSYIQWKPDSIHQLSKDVSEQIEQSGNVEFSFDNEVFSVMKKKDVFYINTSNGEFICKKIILCAGRTGWRWTNKLYKELGLSTNDDYARYGVRVEMQSSHLKEFNKSHCTLTRDKLEIGPFDWFGSIIPEDHADLVISSFRSNEDRWKTDKVSFSLTDSRYFKNEGCHQADRLGKLAFILFNDRVSRERIRLFMKDNSQLSLLPEYAWLKQTIEELDSIFPNLINKGYFHVPTIIPMTSEIKLGNNLETEIDNMFVAGESSGVRGILAAAISGTVAADSACK